MEKISKIGKVLLLQAVITMVTLCLFALLILKVQPSESSIRIGIRILYPVVNFLGGLLIGKMIRQKKFLWGVMTGLIYFVVISLVSFAVHGGFYSDIQHAVTICLLCMAGGMAGGMVS